MMLLNGLHFRKIAYVIVYMWLITLIMIFFFDYCRKGDEYREHGRNHFIQDQISEVFFLKSDPEEDDTECPDQCPHKTTQIHYHCKWVSRIVFEIKKCECSSLVSTLFEFWKFAWNVIIIFLLHLQQQPWHFLRWIRNNFN